HYGYSCWFSCTVNCAIVISFVKLLGSKEEHEPLSSAFDGSSPAFAIVAVETNLDTSTPDTYRAPPAPLPYDVSLPVTENPGIHA
uniref:Uncharacterized protein n=1 Tax=Aegilops tauschii subsp. strangulata TaxID=200361 RepID=A0A452XWL0_AEGTS